MLDLYLRLITKLFRLPELVVCELCKCRNKVLYLRRCNGDSAVWTEEIDDALLFRDLKHAQKYFKFYDGNKHIIFSHLNGRTDTEIKSLLELCEHVHWQKPTN